MNEQPFQSPSSLERDLVVSDDSLARPAEKDKEPHEQRSGAWGSNANSKTSSLKSDDLIPHLSPSDIPPSSHLPEQSERPTSSVDGSSVPHSPLTPEIFASGALPAGTTLGHYVIKSYIGGGGMGRVYLATDSALDRNVAVKILPRQRANDQGTVARFMNEARSAARLNHEHIAQVYFAGEQAGIPYIVFEYVEGTNIRAMVDDFDAFPLPQALNYLIQIAHALGHAADHGVVHRDVKPSNILITREGRAKLIDMGLARLLDPSESQDDLTASGVTLGTFDYISPEQARDPRNADIRSDIYSLGCTFFFMLTGRPPFPEGTVLQKLLQHQGDEPPDIRSFQPNIPSEVAVLLQKMMAKDPRQRFQTPGALIESLVNIAKMLGLQPTGPGKLVWELSPPSKSSLFLRHVPWIAAVLLLLAIFFPMSLYWEQQGRHLTLPDIPPTVRSTSDSSTLPTHSGVQQSSPSQMVENISKRTNFSRLHYVSHSSESLDEELQRHLSHLAGTPAQNNLAGTPASPSPTISENLISPRRIALAVAPQSQHEFWQRVRRGEIWRSVSSTSDLSAAWSVGSMRAVSGAALALTDRGVSASALPTKHIVDPSGEISGSFATLGAALAEAGSGTTIELRWNDVMQVSPMMFVGRKLRIVAAEGYSPLLVFVPSESHFPSPNSRSMFTLGSCDLEFENLAIEMRIQQEDIGLRWSLFELVGGNKVTMNRCYLTICNAAVDFSAYHQDVAFFRNSGFQSGFDQLTLDSFADTTLPTSPTSDSSGEKELSSGTSSATTNNSLRTGTGGTAVSTDENRTDTSIRISIRNSMIRGEGTGLYCEVSQNIECRLENTVVGLAKSFVLAEDSKRTTPQETLVQVFFDRVTFFGRQAFARQYRNSFVTEPMRLAIEAHRSIFFLNNVPLAIFQGARSVQEALSYFQWRGDSNYFQGVSVGWRFRPVPTSTDGGWTEEMPFAEWMEKVDATGEAESDWTSRVDVLTFNEIRKATHRLAPADLEPRQYSGISEEFNVGADSTLLIPLSKGWTRDD